MTTDEETEPALWPDLVEVSLTAPAQTGGTCLEEAEDLPAGLSGSAEATWESTGSVAEVQENEQLPYPSLAPVVFFCLHQSTRPRSWCLALAFDDFIFAFFAVEMVVKMVALGVFGPKCYLGDTWNRLDLFIVMAGMLEYSLDGHNVSFSAIRTVRVLRPLRAINRVPSMRILVTLLLDTLPMLGNVLLLCFFVFFIFGIVGVQLWAGLLRNRCFLNQSTSMKYNLSEFLHEYYRPEESDDIPFICSTEKENGMLHCHSVPQRREGGMWCEVITLEGWVDIMYYVMDAHSFYNFIYFIFLIIVGSFFMINLCLVVIATQFSETKQRENQLMQEQRARFRSNESTLGSLAEPGSCYEEMLKYLVHICRKLCRHVTRLYGEFCPRRRRGDAVSNSSLTGGGTNGFWADNGTKMGPSQYFMTHYHHTHHHQHYIGNGIEMKTIHPDRDTPKKVSSLPLTLPNLRGLRFGMNYPTIMPSKVCRNSQSRKQQTGGAKGTALNHGLYGRKISVCGGFHDTYRLQRGVYPGPCSSVCMDGRAGMASSELSSCPICAQEGDGVTCDPNGEPDPEKQGPDVSAEHSKLHQDMEEKESGGKSCVCLCVHLVQVVLKRIVDSKYFNRGIMIAILINTLSMGVEYHEQTYVCVVHQKRLFVYHMSRRTIYIHTLVRMDRTKPQELTDALEISNIVFTSLFALEMLLKLSACGVFDYISNPYNIFDGIIVIISILGMHLFGCKFTRLENGDTVSDRKNFDSLLWAIVTVFQTLTQEDWNVVLYNGMASTSPLAALYFVALMTFGNYVLFNLLVAILVEGFQAEGDASRSETSDDMSSDFGDEDKLRELLNSGSELKMQTLMPIPNGHLEPRASMPPHKMHAQLNATPRTELSHFYIQSRRNSNTSTEPHDQRSMSWFVIVKRLLEPYKPQWCRDHEDWSLYLFSPQNKFRVRCQKIITHKLFDHIVLFFIFFNCITIALERPDIQPDSTVNTITHTGFTTYIILAVHYKDKVVSLGMYAGPGSYLKSSWNVLDGFLVFVSLVDILVSLASSGGNRILGILRVLRLLRTLRPLRVISRAPGLKLVVETLITSLRPIGNIVLICCAFFIVFGILGVQLFKGKFYHCEGFDTRNITNKSDCLQAKYRWVRRKYNFDNLGQALMSLFVLSSKDGWVNIMYDGLDAVAVDVQPIKNHNPWMLLYFISFLLIVSFFVLNMFVGVVVENFHKCRQDQEEEEARRREEKRQKRMEKKRRKALQRPYYADYSPARLFIHTLCTSHYLDLFITIIIAINVLTMSMEHYGQPKVGNLGLLFMLLFFIYAALGVELFGKLECTDENPCEGLSRHATFQNFGMAFLTLFRVSTGDNWNGIMKDTLRECKNGDKCLSYLPLLSPLYFVTFVLIAQFVLVNVVVAVLMKHLEESNQDAREDAEMEAEIAQELLNSRRHSTTSVGGATGLEGGAFKMETVSCEQGKDPNYGNFLTVERPSISRMLSLPSDSYMLYPVKAEYGSIQKRFSKQDSALPGSSPSLGTQPCEDGALMQLPGTTSQTNLDSVSASHLLTQRTRRSSNVSRILRRQQAIKCDSIDSTNPGSKDSLHFPSNPSSNENLQLKVPGISLTGGSAPCSPQASPPPPLRNRTSSVRTSGQVFSQRSIPRRQIAHLTQSTKALEVMHVNAQINTSDPEGVNRHMTKSTQKGSYNHFSPYISTLTSSDVQSQNSGLLRVGTSCQQEACNHSLRKYNSMENNFLSPLPDTPRRHSMHGEGLFLPMKAPVPFPGPSPIPKKEKMSPPCISIDPPTEAEFQSPAVNQESSSVLRRRTPSFDSPLPRESLDLTEPLPQDEPSLPSHLPLPQFSFDQSDVSSLSSLSELLSDSDQSTHSFPPEARSGFVGSTGEAQSPLRKKVLVRMASTRDPGNEDSVA
ncbi:Voltage-dependent T-type calcium channel subunit alpha-1H [Triplophysa tibetana]|uniref:Voltage-dependent T-type calcium channel subunit alpha-1H n=1 Tax=Triplophysa tibetana TaxID=1572043 RepID=A0A5A9PNL4_9TELE|nr:Voltage-dependent T-type calcium channel subunit alpha-1H [Triplophysa tibetana]